VLIQKKTRIVFKAVATSAKRGMPESQSLEQTDEGADAALTIKSTDSVTALLRFRFAVFPEMVDAIAG
jgi:hypothetical protein